MFELELTTYFLLGSSAVVIGIFAVLFGGTMFLSLPLFQILFPQLPLASIVANIKFGSVWRNAIAVYGDRQAINFGTIMLIIPLGVGSAIGALAVGAMTKVVVPLILVIGWVLSERAKFIKISRRSFWVGAFLVGFYGGIFGAGIFLVIIALLQLKNNNMDLIEARTNALFYEMLLSAVAVVTFLVAGLLTWDIALVWAGGGLIGGYIGGKLVKRTGKLPASQQQWLLRIAFVIAITVAVWQLL